MAMEIRETKGKAIDMYTKKKSIARGQTEPSSNDISIYAMEQTVSVLHNFLRNCRKEGSDAFLERIGYLFKDWMDFKEVLMPMDSIKLEWKVSDASVGRPERHEFPTTKRFDCADDSEKHNVKIFQDSSKSHPEVCLIVEHDVLVSLTAKKIASAVGEVHSHGRGEGALI